MKRLMTVRLVLVGIIIAGLILLVACKPASTTPTGTPQTGTSQTPTVETLKIGVVGWFGWDIGLNMIEGIQVMANTYNQNGGLTVGNKKYPIQLITYDSGVSEASIRASGETPPDVVNRLIFSDNVKFILADPSGIDSWLKLTEANKVILCAASPTTPILSPNNHYSFETGFVNSQPVMLADWFAQHYPDKKNITVALPDDPQGAQFADINQRALEAAGMTVKTVFYPIEQTGVLINSSDLDYLGTQVKSSNPDVFMAAGGFEPMVYAAVWNQGYRGQLISQLPLSNLVKTVPTDALEGLIGITTPAEFDPPQTQPAEQFKQAFAAKYMWDSVGVQYLGAWNSLIAAIQQAGSLDPDKVSAALGNGLRFEGPFGSAAMVNRPDQKNSRTVDSVVSPYFYRSIGGQSVLAGNLSLDDAVSNFKQFYK